MITKGVDFLEDWIRKNVSTVAVEIDAGNLAAKLLAGAAAAGFTLADLELDQETPETYIRDAIMHIKEPGIPGD